MDASIQKHYDKEFVPKLAKNILKGKPSVGQYLPKSVSGRYLQYHYISANPNPLGEKDLLDTESADTKYGKSHNHYHPVMRSLIGRFDYYDMFPIDLDGNIVYTVFKETDYATNLKTGPY